MKLVREHINEKFTQDSDPVHDLGIGIRAKLKIKLDHLSELADLGYSCLRLYNEKYQKYCSANCEEYSMEIVRMIYHTLRKIVDNTEITPQEAYEKTYTEEIRTERYSNKSTIRMICKYVEKILKEEYDIDVHYNFI